jgi:predicted transcriptional regulator of viral defense system
MSSMSVPPALLSHLKKNTFVTPEEAILMGFNKMMLTRLVKQGHLYRVERQVYTMGLEWLTHPAKKYLAVCALYPDAVISGLSALTYHDLTDQEERKTWVMIPQKKRLFNRRLCIIRPTGTGMNLGVLKIRFGDSREIRVFDKEKAIVDAFKHLSEEVALKALRIYLKSKDKNIEKLLDYGRRLKKPLGETVKVLLSEE